MTDRLSLTTPTSTNKPHCSLPKCVCVFRDLVLLASFALAISPLIVSDESGGSEEKRYQGGREGGRAGTGDSQLCLSGHGVSEQNERML